MKPRKSLGQNFLKTTPVAKTMISVGEIKPDDIVLEIGPGKGAITKLLLGAGARVLAVEKDVELFKFLEEKFHKEIKDKKLILINEDILKFDETKKIGEGYKIVANIPYYITGAILKKFLSSQNQPKSITLLVQKEIADRIMARDGKESILSLSVKVYGKPKYIKRVGKNNFSPSPKVDSSIITITIFSKTNFSEKKEEKSFFKIIKAGFAHKRKKLLSNLTQVFGNRVQGYFKKLKIQENARAEELRLEDWIRLVRCLK